MLIDKRIVANFLTNGDFSIAGRKAAPSTSNQTITSSSLKMAFQPATETFTSQDIKQTPAPQQQQANRAQQVAPFAPQKRPREWKKRLGNVGFILYETLASKTQPSINTLQTSAAKQGATLKVEFEVTNEGRLQRNECVVYINGIKYGSAVVTENKKDAKTQACDWALQNARAICYTISVSVNLMSIGMNCKFLEKSHKVVLQCNVSAFSRTAKRGSQKCRHSVRQRHAERTTARSGRVSR